MKFFRAIPSESKVLEKYFRHKTNRLPSNVPYFVDNIWEYFRPENKPSRRFAVYASPTIELALENASHSQNNKAYELLFFKEAKYTQLSVKDAKYHPDIKNIQKEINNYCSNLTLQEKQEISILFLPGITKEDIEKNINKNMKELLQKCEKLVSIWLDIPTENGEFFFELENDNYYYLKRILI